VTPCIDYERDGLRHRKWIFPARIFRDETGQDAERWFYAVGDLPYAVSFTVHTGRYVGHRNSEGPQGTDISWHQAGGNRFGCYALSGAACTCDGSVLAAREWYAAQPKDDEGGVADEAVFAHLCEKYEYWKP
jgi:hypothetical protein